LPNLRFREAWICQATEFQSRNALLQGKQYRIDS
jgi:hypothetical protein